MLSTVNLRNKTNNLTLQRLVLNINHLKTFQNISLFCIVLLEQHSLFLKINLVY